MTGYYLIPKNLRNLSPYATDLLFVAFDADLPCKQGKKGVCANVSLGLYPVQHFPDEPDAQHVTFVLCLPLIVPQLFLLY
jgi:hypothetical protein